jgi:hypothetical protein
MRRRSRLQPRLQVLLEHCNRYADGTVVRALYIRVNLATDEHTHRLSVTSCSITIGIDIDEHLGVAERVVDARAVVRLPRARNGIPACERALPMRVQAAKGVHEAHLKRSIRVQLQ